MSDDDNSMTQFSLEFERNGQEYSSRRYGRITENGTKIAAIEESCKNLLSDLEAIETVEESRS
jgi:hypothetical protein